MDLPDRLHLGRQAVVGAREFLERKARDLGDHVVDGRLERRGGQASGDVVPEFVQRIADRELGRDLGDRKPRRLRRQSRGTGYARVHLDNQDATGLRAHRKLHVRTAGLDADLAQHVDRGIAQALVLLVRQGLRRRDRDRIARVYTHGIEILDRADNDAVVVPVANDLHLELFPADDGLFEQHFRRRRHLETVRNDALELLAVVRNAATRPAERKRWPDNRRKTYGGLLVERLLERMRDVRVRTFETDLRHRLPEQVTVFRHVDRFT